MEKYNDLIIKWIMYIQWIIVEKYYYLLLCIVWAAPIDINT